MPKAACSIDRVTSASTFRGWPSNWPTCRKRNRLQRSRASSHLWEPVNKDTNAMAAALDPVSRSGENRETGWVNRLFQREGYTPEYQELKFTLHRKLLDRITL